MLPVIVWPLVRRFVLPVLSGHKIFILLHDLSWG